MNYPAFIDAKRNGHPHDRADLARWLTDYLAGTVADYQMSAWLMAVCWRGLSDRELADWTELMWKSGASARRVSDAYRVDKHSTGGVGDKTSLLLVPLVTAVCERQFGAGQVHLPMVSGRGLGFTGGTLDKLESVPGFSPRIDLARAEQLLREQGFFMMGQTEDLAPADRLIYSLRDVTGTVESEPLIVSSIMSKKLAETLDGLVLDVKVGRGAFMKTEAAATSLASALVRVARANGVEAVAVVTRMEEPLGIMAGHLLEVMECEDFLSGKEREANLGEITLELAARMVNLAGRGKVTLAESRAACRRELGETRASDRTLALFRKMFEAQGGDWEKYLAKRAALTTSVGVTEMVAPADGYVTSVSSLEVARLVGHLGGARQRKHDEIDDLVGVAVKKKCGDRVRRGETLALCYHRRTVTAEKIAHDGRKIFEIGDAAPAHASGSWILKVIE